VPREDTEMKNVIWSIACIALLMVSASLSFALQVGDKAPLFEGLSTKGKIRLEDFRGKSHVVLAFYFADFTPT
jgi:hypothetical protein